MDKVKKTYEQNGNINEEIENKKESKSNFGTEMYGNWSETFAGEIHKQAEKRISKLEDRTIEMIKSEELKKKRLEKKKGPLRYHKVDQSIDGGSPKRQRERKKLKDYLKK